MKNKIEDLRNHLFETLEALKDTDNPMDLDRAKAIALVGQVIVNSAKAETEYIAVTKRQNDSGFMDKQQLPPPGGARPRLVNES